MLKKIKTKLVENLNDKTETGHNSFEPQKKSNKKLILIIISIIALVIALGIGIFFFVYKKTQDYKNEQIELSAEERVAAINSLFSVPEFDAIPDNYKAHIYDFMEYNNFLDGTYFLTKISDRAKNVFAFGDFTNDDNEEDDLAIIIESNDFKSSKLVVFNHKGELLYIEDYEYDLPTINSYKVGSKIYMDELKLVPSPCDGLIIKTQYFKKALVYDKKDKKFNTYHQYTQEEIDAIKNEEDYDEEVVGEAQVDVTKTMEVTPYKSEDDFKIQEVK